jgi:hypothetical protein
MSTPFFLVSRATKQCVEVACSGGFGLRGSQHPNALVLFCYAHRGEHVELRAETQLDGQLKNEWTGSGELEEWTDADAARRYEALTGSSAPDFDRSET